MPRSRTIKTLACLVVTMTAGAFALLAMETKPAGSGQIIPLTALRRPGDAFGGQINNVKVPLQLNTWTNIVIHDSVCGCIGKFNDDCHFIIYGALSGQADLDGAVRSTAAWQRQSHGRHMDLPGVDFNANSIAICLEGDFAAAAPSAAQQKTLAGLVRSLQRRFNIPPERVYLHGELTGRRCPGDLFPASHFRNELLPAIR